MAWDKPAAWQDPHETRAAAEVARRAEEERRIEDARAQTMADAVRLGFADLAAAIVTAAGPEAIAVWRQRQQDLRDGASYGHLPTSGDCSLGIDPDGFNEASAQVDSDIDDLIDEQ
jgi:hypothetical protein